MILKPSRLSRPLRSIGAVVGLFLLAGCAATAPKGASPQEIAAARTLAEARSSSKPIEQRATLYLQAAQMTAPMLGSGMEQTSAHDTYNSASAELTALLRNNENGRLWKNSLDLTNGGSAYHLRLQPPDYGVWSPEEFTAFQVASTINEKRVKTKNHTVGVGGALVGLRNKVPRENFAPKIGITAAVTATLDFKGKEATLALRRPARQPTALVAGKVRPLAADYSAPLLVYPHVNETLAGLAGAVFGSKYMNKIGLYFLEPYDPTRIPVVLVHGLISTPQMWLNVIDDLKADPELRKRYQFWVFAYPTGNPVLYSSLRLREALAQVDQLYPDHKNYVLVGHSMGGLLSRLQVSTFTRADWERQIGQPANDLFAKLEPNEMVYRALVFKANPEVKRVVFICTPHRGSELAVNFVGQIGMRLFTLPATLANTIKTEVSEPTLKQLNGGRLPNSVTNLQPTAPYIKVMEKEPIHAPHNTILGDRGKGGCPNCSDGVVPYWSSHLDDAQSQLIVPGPHGSCELPQTIAELKRILHLYLKTAGAAPEPNPKTKVTGSPEGNLPPGT